jgi:signal transduction histidine kinase
LIADALAVMARGEDRVLRVIGTSPRRPDATLEVVLYEAPMRDAMVAFSIRILTLSIIISLITATLVYVSLQWLMVRPILQLTESMTRFRERPEDETAAIRPGTRRDEIGVAERELATMQTDLRQALIEKTRLAALGAAVAKINHDLRNTLSTAVLASDRLGSVSDPEVQRVLPQLYKAIDRAVALCSRTLDFVQDVRASVRRERLTVGLLVSDLAAALREAPSAAGGLRVIAEGGMDLAVDGDRDQLFRVFHNLALNAAQAGAAHLRVQARSGPVGSPQAGQRHLVIEFADDGPGIPDSVRDRLFQPFAISTRPGGSGLGLSIAREIVAAHGGKLVLAATGAEGTIFRIELPSPS